MICSSSLREMDELRGVNGKWGAKKAPVYSSLKDFELKNPARAYSFYFKDRTDRLLGRTVEVEKDKNAVRCRCGNCGYHVFVVSNFTTYNGDRNGVTMDNVEIREMKCIYCRTIVDGKVPIRY